jgi:hypothetical protein
MMGLNDEVNRISMYDVAYTDLGGFNRLGNSSVNPSITPNASTLIIQQPEVKQAKVSERPSTYYNNLQYCTKELDFGILSDRTGYVCKKSKNLLPTRF